MRSRGHGAETTKFNDCSSMTPEAGAALSGAVPAIAAPDIAIDGARPALAGQRLAATVAHSLGARASGGSR